ncbi:MAG: hypothetical protein HN964_04300 [Candidatus Jacksonbacteria bacterium]|nr:hypothetical protein [Candidatus Jacksonbacteria bacterium]
MSTLDTARALVREFLERVTPWTTLQEAAKLADSIQMVAPLSPKIRNLRAGQMWTHILAIQNGESVDAVIERMDWLTSDGREEQLVALLAATGISRDLPRHEYRDISNDILFRKRISVSEDEYILIPEEFLGAGMRWGLMLSLLWDGVEPKDVPAAVARADEQDRKRDRATARRRNPGPEND